MPNLQQLVPSVLPPIIYNFVDRLVKTHKYPLYPSYAAALSKCSSNGYENELLIDVMTYKMKRHLEHLETNHDRTFSPTQVFTFMSLTQLMAAYPDKKVFHILDFGGSLGGHFYDVKKIFGDALQLKWAVVETPALAAAGQAFATDELSFFDNLESAVAHLGTVDLVHSSGTLQCVDNPRHYLQKLMDLGAKNMLFNRMAVNRKNRDVITVHQSKLSWNGQYGLPPHVEDRVVSYPFTFLSERDFYATLATQYDITARYSDNTGIISLPTEEIVGGALLLTKK